MAAARGYVVVTNDLDFGAILAATRRRGPSVIQIRSDRLTTDSIGEIVLAAARDACEELLAGAIVSVDATRSRLHVLPLLD
jgi:predicted nuclease of predicted toxin-antitoxin system